MPLPLPRLRPLPLPLPPKQLEDRLHESDENLEALENQKRDALRQRREMETIYEAERSSMNKEREDMASREEEMQSIIQRLKDSLTQRSNTDEDSRLSRRCKGIPADEVLMLTSFSKQLLPEP